MRSDDIIIRGVATDSDLQEFIRFPYSLYRNDPYWVPPLFSERRKIFSYKHNPFYDHAEVSLWLAMRGDEVLGTISSHVDHLHNEVHTESLGMFGFFECINDLKVAEKLLNKALKWAQARGMTSLRGPLNFSQNQECGLLIDGFNSPPTIMMPYNPPHYVEFLERLGLRKVMDLFAYTTDLKQFNGDPERLPSRMKRISAKLAERGRISIRHADMKTYKDDLVKIKQVYNQAWKDNWGFVPLTDAEFNKLTKDLVQIIEPSLVIGAEIDGEPAGIILAIPDINQALKNINGRLFPTGWIKYLWHTRKITRARVIIMGVYDEYRGKGIETLLVYNLLKEAILSGYQSMEYSWILENNTPANQIISSLNEDFGTHIYRRYRLYETPIPADV
jgi:GNAT superfamily N-acetyltransferase